VDRIRSLDSLEYRQAQLRMVHLNIHRLKMIHVLIITRDVDSKARLRSSLGHDSVTASYAYYDNDLRQAVITEKPGAILCEMGGKGPEPDIWDFVKQVKRESKLPVIALVQRDKLDIAGSYPDIDDILVAPYDVKELVMRINRLTNGKTVSREQIKSTGLIIDPDLYEVRVDGSKVDLTYKEFELLKLLASNKGRVFTREALLDKIWGYDYFGGDRTVDVHVRRLRSKIEDANHTYIETVRNIGYRFTNTDFTD
jgi:two-component system alkaline phosphatase synthesis response regulator PhoP